MIKKKKVARFRELYDDINQLLQSYSYDDVVKILHNDYDLDITAKTLNNYVYRHRKQLAEQAVVENETVQHSKDIDKSSEVDISLEEKDIEVDRKEVQEKGVSSAPSKNAKKKKATPEELKAALAKMKSQMTEEEYNWEDLL